MTSAPQPTLVTELTPPGRGAVAVVLVGGPLAVEAIGRLFRPISRWGERGPDIDRIMLGRWGSPEGEELVVCRRASDEIEVHCHGGRAAVRAIIDSLVAEGCEQCDWRAWVEGSNVEPLRAAAHVALADATTLRTAAILVDQFHGALTAALQTLISAIAAKQWEKAGALADELLSRCDLGRHLTSPWRVVLTGAPNVGKSSLMNRLAGFERAIVSPTPGTTRDVVTMHTAVDGWPIELSDTAGLRASQDALERAGIEAASAALARADLVVIVHEAARPCTDDTFADDLVASARGGSKRRAFVVLNKIDLQPAAAPSGPANVIATSAVTGQGLPELISSISRALVPEPPDAGAAVPFLPHHAAALAKARTAIIERDGVLAAAAIDRLLHESA